MTGDTRPVSGRAAALRGTSALMWPYFTPPPGARRPVIFFEGGRGSGKSALLDALTDRMEQRVPHARAGFSDNRHEDIPGTLSFLAGQLSRHRPRYRRLRFPRLIIGLLVQEQDLDLARYDFEQARRVMDQQVKRRLNGTWLQRLLKQLVGSPPQLSIQLGPTVTVLRLPLNALAALLGRTLPSRSLRWFGHRDRDLTDRDVDTLVELNTWARTARDHPDDPDGQEARNRVAGLLCEAFLADLRDAPRRVRRLRTPVLLLDDADTEGGRVFLRLLLEARAPLGPGARAEPLTVVATGRSELPEMTDAPVRDLTDVTDGTLPSAAPATAPGTAGSGEEYPLWLRYRLPDLTRSDITGLLGGRADPRLASLIQQFTAGHPESAAMLAAVAARAPSPSAGIGQLLAQPVPDPAGLQPSPAPGRPTVGDHLTARLLPVGAAQLPAYARCAAARGEADGLRLVYDSGLVDAALRDAVRLAAPWERAGDSGATVLRRLLLRRLAADPADWEAAHRQLLTYCLQRQDRPGELYHRLALGELTAVAESLTARLRTTPGAAWLALVRAVAAAPFGPADRRPETPYELFTELVGGTPVAAGDGELGQVVHLVAALRIIADPSTGVARGFLYAQTASSLGAVATLPPDGLVVLHRAADEYRDRGRRWS
jgi:hypothetical protein